METLIAIVLAVLLLEAMHRLLEGHRPVPPSIELTLPEVLPEGPSLFERLAKAVEKTPDRPIEDSTLPPVPLGGSGVSVAPGLADARLGGLDRGRGGWRKVKRLIEAINKGAVLDWRVLDGNLRGLDTLSEFDPLLEHLEPDEITPEVRRLFMDVARGSHDFEAVKWGMGIGGLRLGLSEAEDLMILARHGEFTVHAVHAIARKSITHPIFKTRLVDLLPVTRGWGLVRVLEYLSGDQTLLEDREIQREMLVRGMEGVEGLALEVAFPLAGVLDMPYFMELAVEDEEVFTAVAELMTALLTEPAPLGGLTDLPDPEGLLGSYLLLLSRRLPDIRLLSALHELQSFLDEDPEDIPLLEEKKQRVQLLFERNFHLDCIRAGIGQPRTHWMALRLVEERELRDLLPDVEEAFRKNPDLGTISVLGSLGGREEIQVMVDSLPRLVDLESRRSIPISQDAVLGPEHLRGFEIAGIIRHAGRLGTPQAVGLLKQMGRDYDPEVRRAACLAIAELPARMVDDDLRAILEERIRDGPSDIVESARMAARKLGLPFAAK